jgi:hypothetical protein
MSNPFAADPDRGPIWEMLMTRDFAAFAAQDWSMVEGDFLPDRFLGVHGRFSPDPSDWRPDFPTLERYRDEWLRQAAASAATSYAEPLAEALLKAVTVPRIDVEGDRAVLHKVFDGAVRRADGTQERLDWLTLYLCHRVDGRWRIAGFMGYLGRRAG